MLAHRTCPLDAPENSLEGIRRAAADGADYVEVDVRRSRDGVPVLLHDPLLLRTATWPVPVSVLSTRRVTARRLRRSSEHVPSLEAALAALAPSMGMAIDVKDPGAVPAIVEVVDRAGALGRVLLWSQHLSAVRQALRSAPGVEVALLRNTSTPEQTATYLRDARAAGAHAVSLHEAATTAAAVARARSLGLRVYSWVQHESRTAEALALDLDGVVTDWPAAARGLLRR